MVAKAKVLRGSLSGVKAFYTLALMDMIKLLLNLKLRQSSEMSHHIVFYVGINILEEPDTSTIQCTRMIT
jgi:hypothetical protein